MKNNLFRALMVFVSLTLVFSIVFSVSSSAVTKEELQDQIEDIKSDREEKEEEYKEHQKDVAKQNAKVTALVQQMDALQKEIRVFQQDIDKLNAEKDKINVKIDKSNKEIAKLKKDVDKKQKEVAKIKEKLAVRLKATYMAGSGSTLKLLLSADNLATYLTTSEMIKRIADNDSRIINSFVREMKKLTKLQDEHEAEIAKLEVEQEKLDDKIDKINIKKAPLEKLEKEISEKSRQANDILTALGLESEEYRKQIAFFESEEVRLDREVQAMINASNASRPNRPNNGGSVSGGSSGSTENYVPSTNLSGYINPVPYSNRYVSSPYGYRTDPISGEHKFHSGMDITCAGAGGSTGPFTKQIVAAKAGTVSYAGWLSGYGNTVMIYHADGYTTLYAHNYSLSVVAGQTVSQGQQISIMGTTGYSTGAHCHFELRDSSGVKINPAPYIS